MLRESKLTLSMACDMCKDAESTATQVQLINRSENESLLEKIYRGHGPPFMKIH